MKWMDLYENDAKHNLAETCCASISLDDLQTFSGSETDLIDYSQKQVYGAIRGSGALRSNIARLYSSATSEPLRPDDVLVTNGAIQANFLALYTNVGAGDHVICHYPTYQQLYSVPTSLGAEVSLWKSSEDNGWQLDTTELKSMIKPNTRLIILNNPQNPTGAVLQRQTLQEIVEVARQHDIIIHCDEVYRPLFHSLDPSQPETPPSILDFGYDKAISTGSMSKAFSLAGIRLGWIASRNALMIEALASARDYTLISVGQLDDRVATQALSSPTVDNLLERNYQLAKQNLDDLEAFVREFKWAASWTRPQAGTTAFIKFAKDGTPVDDVAFCEQLLEQSGVMFVPGSRCFGNGQDFKGYVRVGYVPERQVMVAGLEALRKFMRDGYERIPVQV
ncbi:Capreomycidine synthase [Penicillium rolfsii]|nr:Capreomycidine synthase [Penicillium rolfsii]